MALKIKWDELTPLNEDGINYQPEMEQILGYAEYIGLKMPEDEKYLYVARQGLKCRLPPFWQACENEDGDIFFRNKKTRIITVDNPLDEIYIQKIAELKRLEAQTNIFSINEESALNESSGMYKSKLRASDLRRSDRQTVNNLSQGQKVLERHITEESFEMENASAEKASPHKSDVVEKVEPTWKIEQRLELLQLKSRLEATFPKKEEMITNADLKLQSKAELQNIMDMGNLSHLIELRLKVEQKRLKLEMHQRQRRKLQQVLDAMREKRQIA